MYIHVPVHIHTGYREKLAMVNNSTNINKMTTTSHLNSLDWKNRQQHKPEALKSLYRSPGNKKKQLVLCKNYVLRHLGITINIKNTKFVKDLPMIDAQFRFNQCNSFREEYISVFSPYGSVLIL